MESISHLPLPHTALLHTHALSLIPQKHTCPVHPPPPPYPLSLHPTEWSDVANSHLSGLGIKWEDYKHKLYVVPPGDMCSWGGMGYVGCTKDCRAWISGDLWQVRA